MSDWCPSGYVPFADLPETIERCSSRWETAVFRGARQYAMTLKGSTEERRKNPLLLTLGPLLTDGRLRAAALLNDSGRLVEVPPAVWRRLPYRAPYADIGPHPQSMFEAALGGAGIDVPFDGWSSMRGRPVLALHALAAALGAAKPPPAPAIQPESGEQEPPSRTVVAAPAAARWGRPPQHDWDAIWIEVALFMADNGSDTQDRERLQTQMAKWTAERWKTPPDPATIRAKLKALYDAASKRA